MIFPPEKRSSAHYQVSEFTYCIVSSSQNTEMIPVYLVDISTSGLSFFVKDPRFEVHDAVQVSLLKNQKRVEITGSVVEQRILYPEGVDDLKYDIYRYSLHFANPISTDWVDHFRDRPSRSH